MNQKRMTHRASEPITNAGKGGEGIQSFKYTSDGTPDALLFADFGLPDMADALYRVFPAGETVAAVKVDESTIATSGFTILGGGAGEVVHVLVHGRIAGTPQV